MREGRWEPGRFQGIELRGKALGLVGLGPIGMEMARLGAAIGMRLLGWTRRLSPERAAHGLALVALEEVFSRSDVVSLHLSYGPETAGIISRALLERMKAGRVVRQHRPGAPGRQRRARRSASPGAHRRRGARRPRRGAAAPALLLCSTSRTCWPRLISATTRRRPHRHAAHLHRHAGGLGAGRAPSRRQLRWGASGRPPSPPALGAPRPSRGAPRFHADSGGPTPRGKDASFYRGAHLPINLSECRGAPAAPRSSHRSVRTIVAAFRVPHPLVAGATRRGSAA